MFASRREILLALVSVGVFGSLSSSSGAFCGAHVQVNTDWEKIAIQGYDTVAYFTDGKPIKGTAEFETEWQGARWRFANAEHKALFTEQPESYAPRFGGFCAGAMMDGLAVRANPEAWAIVDGKLYLNADKAGLAEWQQDATGNIAKAEEGWNTLPH